MRCLACGKRIGPLRRLVDERYCSDRHRLLPRKSARLVREVEERGELEEPWLVTELTQPATRSQGGALTAVGLLLVAGLVVLLLMRPPGSRPLAGSRSLPLAGKLSEQLERALPGSPPLELREDFRRGVREWFSPAGAPADRFRQGGVLRPGPLLLWKPTLGLRNYEFAFEGEIERKALAWVFRAADTGNYYAVKIRLAEPRSGGAAIERYVVQGGERSKPVRLPIPVRLEAGTPFQVSVRVRADQFITMIDDQVVDLWRDSRHARGGVGFFSDPGEAAAVRWVRLTDTTSLLERLKTFGFILPPPR